MAECYRCPYTEKIKRKYGSTIHCILEPSNLDVTYFCSYKHKTEENALCPFVNTNTRFPGIDYHKYETEFLFVKGEIQK
jgi:hypothetical protein